jgi:DNA invertase Pin-like site-specific DNA recombinase
VARRARRVRVLTPQRAIPKSHSSPQAQVGMPEIAAEVRRRAEVGHSVREIATLAGVSKSTVHRLLSVPKK